MPSAARVIDPLDNTVTLISGDRVTPYCSPEIAASLASPADLADAVLLHDERDTDWAI